MSTRFLFSTRYRLARHLLFWALHILFFALVWLSPQLTLLKNIVANTIWLPARILYSYPLMYWAIPGILLRGRYSAFIALIVLWVALGWYLNIVFRLYVFIPMQDMLGFNPVGRNAGQPGTFLVLTTTAGITCMIALFKHWVNKQQEWMQAQQEKITAELQILKAQVHPHFLFNTLNNIYSFSLTNSPKTSTLILKLSSLLSYMLYDCKADQVLLEKELEVMKDYVDLETERYGNKIEISWDVEGDMDGKYIVPLLLLPFLENAFKHGTSEQLEKPWLNFNLNVKQQVLKCKVANSKNESIRVSSSGIGIENVQKRLALLYPGKYELKINDEGDFYVVSLMLQLQEADRKPNQSPPIINSPTKKAIV